VGKTALAVHWAHQARDQFPDGHLYIDLRGYGPDQPVQPNEALAAFLRALGVDNANIPNELAERAARFRTMVDGRRVLVILDNARAAEQVRPLLPGTPTCFVVVTSRESLAGLVARDGAHRVDLDLLPPDEAITLLRSVIGERLDTEPEATSDLVGLCARLPLALRLAAERITTYPTATVADLATELASEQRRLDLLDADGDPHTAIRAVFSWSYRDLAPKAARAFRACGIHPGRDIDAYAVAALVDTGLNEAHRLIGRLRCAKLVAQTTAGRIQMHDLLRDYAAELATHEDSRTQRQVALTRLFDHYRYTAIQAMNLVAPQERWHRPNVAEPASPKPPLPDREHAMAWLQTERPNLIAIAQHAADHGWPIHTIHLSRTLFRYLATRAHYDDALTLHTLALTAGREIHDRTSQCDSLRHLGSTYWRLGRHDEAFQNLNQALILATTIGDRTRQITTLDNLGVIHERIGLYQEAIRHYHQAVNLASDGDNQIGPGNTFCNLGIVHYRLGQYDNSLHYYEQALAIAHETNDTTLEGHTRCNIGALLGRLGRHEEALHHLQKSLSLANDLGNRAIEGRTHDHLGLVYLQLGHYDNAALHHQQALTVANQTGERFLHGWTLNNLGTVYQRMGHHDDAQLQYQHAITLARDINEPALEAGANNGLGQTARITRNPIQAIKYHQRALTLANQIGSRYEKARAHDGLAVAHHDLYHRSQARRHWQHALNLYTKLGVPEAGPVRDHLERRNNYNDVDPI
jgi:tetratricopeptide (TPR) repeat protein